MPMDKKALLDRMAMPKKPGQEEEGDMLEFSPADMEEAPGEEAPASAMDLSSVSDDELLAEAKKRGLVPESDMEQAAEPSSEMDMEVEEA